MRYLSLLRNYIDDRRVATLQTRREGSLPQACRKIEPCSVNQDNRFPGNTFNVDPVTERGRPLVVKIKRKIPVENPHPPSPRAGCPLSRGAGEGFEAVPLAAPRPHCGRGCRAQRGGGGDPGTRC